MPIDHSVPDPNPILDLLVGFRRSKVMFAAVELGIFDALEGQPKSLETLATETQTHADSLERLLNACTGLGLIQKENDAYANSPLASTYLTTKSPRRMTGYINSSNRVTWRLFAHLEDAIREGTPRWKQEFDVDRPIFSLFYKDDVAKYEFLMGMNGFGQISSPVVTGAFDLSRFRKMVDLGGATGHLVLAACQRYPELRGVVFDLPEAIGLAQEMVSASPVADRVEVIGGNFFTDSLPQADLYALGRILHDWSEPKIHALLQRIYDHLPPGGGLLIVEKILEEDKRGPDWSLMQDLNMLICTEGRERTLAEYEALLQKAGFKEVHGCRTTSPADAILALKA